MLGVGGATRGSRRWIELPFFRFQPSELGKVLLVLALSAFVLDRLRRTQRPRDDFTNHAAGAGADTVGDGPARPRHGIVYVTIALALLFVAGTKWTHFAALGGLAAAAAALVLVIAPAAGAPVLKGYQKDRLTAFLHKNNADPQSQGYQLNQAETAIGSGRKTGRGQRSARPRRGSTSCPRATRTSSSRWSASGTASSAPAIVLSLYALLIWRALRILTIAKNLYGALLAAGVGAMLHDAGIRERRR